jgi:hypothetical protein
MKTLKMGTVVFVSEQFLRWRFNGWYCPWDWHRGTVVNGYEPGDMVSLPSVGVNVMVCDLRDGDAYIGAEFKP